ncbi:MAG: hypothetical protein GOV15_00910, partial [Candidatus Diapherotrites archaeon]|nr:hypothetical protein [Candidatus Diapherotrites archaeon]
MAERAPPRIRIKVENLQNQVVHPQIRGFQKRIVKHSKTKGRCEGVHVYASDGQGRKQA